MELEEIWQHTTLAALATEHYSVFTYDGAYHMSQWRRTYAVTWVLMRESPATPFRTHADYHAGMRAIEARGDAPFFWILMADGVRLKRPAPLQFGRPRHSLRDY